MCRSAKRLFFFQIAILAATFFCVAPLSAQQVSVLNAGWEGNDYVIRFSDSLDYTVDLAASDSMLVLNFSRPVMVNEGSATGPNGIIAGFSRSPGDSMTTLTVRKQNRVEYSTLWRPYSHRLIVHTFNSDSLRSQYAANQYHLGLLALEQGLEEQGRSYLSSALAFDNGEIARRASSILGVMYAREGKDSLARIYLSAPFDADDFMARAELRRRAGEMEGAKSDEEAFQKKLGEMGGAMEHFVDSRKAAAENNPAAADQTERPAIVKIFDDGRGILLIAIAALIIIALAVWFSRRPAAPAGTAAQHRHDHTGHHQHSHQPEGVRESVPAPTPVAETPKPTHQPAPSSAVEPVAADPVAPVVPIVPAPQPPTPPPAEVRPESAPEPIISALQSPDIVPPPQSAAEHVEEIAEKKEPVEATQLPRPDALPNTTQGAGLTEPPPPPPAAPVSTAAASRRGSAQADQLRQRMQAALSGSSQTPAEKRTTSVKASEPESTITEARRLNVSRDYVELRNRIVELRERIEQAKAE